MSQATPPPALPPAEARDAHLQAALFHAPDRDDEAPAHLSARILQQAAQANGRRAPAGQATARWRERWLRMWYRPRPAGALATVLVAGLVGLMWREGPPADPRAEADTVAQAPQVAQTPGVASRPQEPSTPAPAPTSTPAPAPAPTSIPRPNRAAPSSGAAAPPVVAAERAAPPPRPAAVAPPAPARITAPTSEPALPSTETAAATPPGQATASADQARPAPAAVPGPPPAPAPQIQPAPQRADARPPGSAAPTSPSASFPPAPAAARLSAGAAAFNPLRPVLDTLRTATSPASVATRGQLLQLQQRLRGPWQAASAPDQAAVDVRDEQGRLLGRLWLQPEQVHWQDVDAQVWRAPLAPAAAETREPAAPR